MTCESSLATTCGAIARLAGQPRRPAEYLTAEERAEWLCAWNEARTFATYADAGWEILDEDGYGIACCYLAEIWQPEATRAEWWTTSPQLARHGGLARCCGVPREAGDIIISPIAQATWRTGWDKAERGETYISRDGLLLTNVRKARTPE